MANAQSREAPSNPTELILQPKQDLLRWYVEETAKKIIGFGGSRGGSKSAGLQRVQLIRRWKWPQTRGLILRRKYKELKENHIDPFFTDFPQLRRYYNVSDKTMTLPNGAALVFWHAETFADLKALQGTAFMDVGVDEATHFAQEELEWLRAINRQKGIEDGLCKTIWPCNPGDIGHAFIKRVCVDGSKDRAEYRENENPDEYAFIQAFGWDNAFWADSYLKSKGLTHEDYYRLGEKEQFDVFTKFTDYGRSLMALPEALRAGWLFGLWDKFKGQYFNNFIKKRHVAKYVDPNVHASGLVCVQDGKVYKIEPWWPKWLSLDWGFSDDSVALWHTTAPDGRHITYREWSTNNVTPRMLGTGILERSVDSLGRAEKIEQFFVSPDAFDDRTGQSTIAEQLRESACLGNRIPNPAEASRARISGWQLLYDLFEKDGLLIAEDCPVLIGALPTLVRFGYGEAGDVEDIKPSPIDHGPDSLRYGMFSRLGAPKIPATERAKERVQGVTDPTDRAMILEKFYADEAKKGQPVPIARRHGTRKKFGF